MPARDRRVLLYATSLLLDCLALTVGYIAATFTRDSQWLTMGGQPILVIAMPVFVMFEIAREVQSVETMASRSLATSRSLGALGATALVVLLTSFLLKENDISRIGFVTFFGVTAGALVLSKLLIDLLVYLLLGGSATAGLLILDGVDAPAEPGMDRLDVASQGIWPDLACPASIDLLSRLVSSYDRIVVACDNDHREAWATFLRGSDVGGELVVNASALLGAVAIGECGGRDTLILSRGPLSFANRLQKRAFDLAITVPLLVLLAVPMLIVALLIRLDSPGPALFRQVRVGQGNRQFKMYKFRSMRAEQSDRSGARSTGRDDDRITRIGRFIRRTSIDELPQLLNVVRGEMSLVGPRPHALGSLAGDSLFWEVTDNYWLRHAFKPGLTGLAQIRGYRGATEKREDLECRVKADLEYATNWSPWLDFLILLKTARVVVHSNAY